jgi:hypothetical protein
MRCGVGKILAYNSPNRPPTAHVATLPLHYRYRYAAKLSCALSSWLLEWSAAILITLDIVNTKNTSHIERKTRLSSLNPKGYFILRNKQLDSSCLSSIGRVLPVGAKLNYNSIFCLRITRCKSFLVHLLAYCAASNHFILNSE